MRVALSANYTKACTSSEELLTLVKEFGFFNERFPVDIPPADKHQGTQEDQHSTAPYQK